MKIGVYSESSADQAALAVFLEGILGEPLEPINMALQANGVTDVLADLDGIVRGLHYLSDADGLVVVVDCDDTDLHETDHDPLTAGNCRHCQIRLIITRAQKQLKARQGRPALKVAIGLAVPAIEAWYLVGRNHQVGEAAWRVGLRARQLPFTRAQLKEELYGTDRPSLELETACATAEARRLRANIQAIETAFPVGFGSMAQEIRSWLGE